MTRNQSSTQISQTIVEHTAQLANIPLKPEESVQLLSAFQETLHTIENLQEVDTAALEPTHQVTGLTNIFRADEVDAEHQFSQAEALENAPWKHQGYFVVPRILDTNE